jgi:hypothetical protein
MAILTIPTSTTLAVYRFTIELEDVVYGLSFFWNNRDERWYFDLSDEDGNLLRAGLKAVTGWPEAGINDLGDSVSLTYVEEADLG